MRTYAALVLAGLSASAVASDWSEWLTRAERAQSALNFDGVLIVEAGDELRAYDIRQRVTQSGIEQSVTALNGSDRRLVRGPQGVSVLMGQGDQRLAVAPLGFSASLLEPLSQAYAVSIGPRDRMAGRDAQRLDFTPRQDDRFALRLWLDAETALPLRSDQIGADGERLERRLLAKINVLGFGRGSSVPSSPTITPLKNGFVAIASGLPVQGMGNARQWLLTDGVAYVSVFTMPNPSGISAWRNGALAQQFVATPAGTIVVLGNAPDGTLRTLAEAVAQTSGQ